jgi:hypothetical protein
LTEPQRSPVVRFCLDAEGDYTFVSADGDDSFVVCVSNPLGDWLRMFDLAHAGGFVLPTSEQGALEAGVPFFARRTP